MQKYQMANHCGWDGRLLFSGIAKPPLHFQVTSVSAAADDMDERTFARLCRFQLYLITI